MAHRWAVGGIESMSMIKRGDGSTGRIVESRDSEDSGVCTGCGKLFTLDTMKDGLCEACGGEDAAPEAVEAQSSGCCCCNTEEPVAK
jgi:hypothetical protein